MRAKIEKKSQRGFRNFVLAFVALSALLFLCFWSFSPPPLRRSSRPLFLQRRVEFLQQ